jgi:magnesium-transporting ATPase (P-type)
MTSKTTGSPVTTAATADELKAMPLTDIEKTLRTSTDGLSQAEAQQRLGHYGPNEIAEHKPNPVLKFLSYFWGPIPWMIEVAVILSGVLRHWPDFIVILVLLAANGFIGFWEERSAGRAVATAPGSPCRRANSCQGTSSGFGSATSCRPTPACSTATRWRWTSPR